MNELSIIRYAGTEAADSRQVAEAIGTTHNELLKRIRTYCEYLNEGKIPLVDFFIESTYTDSKGEERPCYMVTRKGCEMIANKMTGKKGVTFTALYVNAFHEMEQRTRPQTTELSPMLQYLIQMEQRQNQLEEKQQELEKRVEEERITAVDAAMALGAIGPELQRIIKRQIDLRAVELCQTAEIYAKLGNTITKAIYKAICKHFSVKSYKELRMCHSVDAVAFVMDWQPDDRLQEKLYFATPKPDLSLLNALFPGEEEE